MSDEKTEKENENDKEEVLTIEKPKKTEETLEKKYPPEIQKVLDYLKEEGDLSIYVAISMADEHHIKNDKVEMIFSAEKKVHYELLKQKIFEAEEVFKKVLGRNFELRLDIKDETERTKKVKKKLMTLFGEEDQG